MNILVTGGCGFIGSNFIRHLILENPGHPRKIVNLDKLTYAGNPANLSEVAGDSRYVFVQGDIGNETLVAGLLFEHEIDAVVNFAAESHVDRSIDSPEPFVQTNVVGTLRLLNAAKRHWMSLSLADREDFRFLHVSTDEVYGSLGPADPAFTEKTPFSPNSPYAASKAASDHLVRAYHHTFGLPTLTTNCSNNYGPYHFPEKLIPLVILNALENKPLPVYGDGKNVRDWLYVGDHCAGIRAVLERGRLGETYNIGGRNEMQNIAVVQAICKTLDELRPRRAGSYAEQISFVKDRPGHDRRYAIDCRKIEAELGWRPAETFASGIARTIAWYLGAGAWVSQVASGKYREWSDLQYDA